MATSDAVTAFIENLPAERREQFERVRDIVLHNLPAGYEEAVVRNMVVYQVPLAAYPDTYNKQALWYVAMSSDKASMSLHLMPIYGSKPLLEKLLAAYEKAGRKPDMGKACVRYKKANDLPLDTVGEIVASIPMDKWIELARSVRRK